MLLLASTLNAKVDKSMINAVNQQKVLLQQILKEYSFLGMGNTFKGSQGKLKKYLIAYTKSFTSLQSIFKDTKSKEALEKSQMIWNSIEKDFHSTPAKDKTLALQKESDKILQEMSILMNVLLSKDKESKHDIVSIARYQGVIIERMAALYMMKTWGISDPKFNFKMKESITFFNNSLHKLLNSPQTTTNNKKKIKAVMRSFKFFEIMNRSKNKFIPTLIYKKTTKIHQEIKKITQAYINEGK
jgi:hypothetical protein